MMSGKESITLCHWGPIPKAPTFSSFVLKLMAYLRMSDIPYVEEFTSKTSSKGKMPYIKDGGKEIADSNFIIEYLKKKNGRDLNSDLSAADKAVSLAFKRLIEENLYWTLVHFNWIVDSGELLKELPMSGIRKMFLTVATPIAIKPKVKSTLESHGMGRHSKEEISKIMEDDMTAISNYLGDKAFFNGDTPTEIDAALFGLLACCMYASPRCPQKKFMEEKLRNLIDHTERMKTRYFPDWDKLCRDGIRTSRN